VKFLEIPTSKPSIITVKDEFRVGEFFNPLCTSWNSHPPANLSWFINGEPVKYILNTSKFVVSIMKIMKYLIF